MTASAPRKNAAERDENRSCPAVSQICSVVGAGVVNGGVDDVVWTSGGEEVDAEAELAACGVDGCAGEVPDFAVLI